MLEKKITIGCYEMTLNMSRRCVRSCKDKIEDDIPYILFTMETMLSRPDMADCLLNEVRVGSRVVIVDETNNYTYTIQVGTEDLYVLDIQDHRYEPIDPKPSQRVFVINPERVMLCA